MCMRITLGLEPREERQHAVRDLLSPAALALDSPCALGCGQLRHGTVDGNTTLAQ